MFAELLGHSVLHDLIWRPLRLWRWQIRNRRLLVRCACFGTQPQPTQYSTVLAFVKHYFWQALALVLEPLVLLTQKSTAWESGV